MKVKRNVALMALLFLPSVLYAQWKIPPESRGEWMVYETVHFQIHYRAGLERTALQAAVYSEEAAAYLERILKHRQNAVIPIFIYLSHQDFSSANVLPFEIGEGTGGFTDFLRRRVNVPFSGDYADLRHVLTHEIVHAYTMDIATDSESPGVSLWLMEGMAEYLSIGWDSDAERYLRDAVLYGNVPSIIEMEIGVADPYANYKIGQAVMLFIKERWGIERIGHFYREVLRVRDLNAAFLSSFRMDLVEFDIAFAQFIRSRYSKDIEIFYAKRDDRVREVSFRYRDGKGFHLQPVLSPDGRWIAAITQDSIFPALSLRRAPGPGVDEDEVAQERIVLRALRSSDYEEFHPMTTNLAFFPDGNRLLVTGRSAGRQAALIIDLRRRKIIRTYEPPFDGIHHPSISPDGTRLLFTGILRGKADLYELDLATGGITRHTNDAHYESGAVYAPDGTAIYFASARNRGDGRRLDQTEREIYRLDSKRGETVRITDVKGRCEEPMPGKNGSLYALCDHTGISNVYRIDGAQTLTVTVGEERLIPITSSGTGVLEPSLGRIDGEGEALLFTEIEEGAREIRMLPARTGTGALSRAPLSVSSVFRPAGYAFPSSGERLAVDPDFSDRVYGYEPVFIPEFLFLMATVSSEGNPALFGFGRLSDDTGNHRLTALISGYQSQEAQTVGNFTVQYDYRKYRSAFFTGLYKQSGTEPVLNFFDLSLNDLLYNPYFRLLRQDTYGAYAGLEYPFHKYSALYYVLGTGRDEKVFRANDPIERPQGDIFHNYVSSSFVYRYDNSVYTPFGPLDGSSLTASYSVPMNPTGSERSLYTASIDYRVYHLFDDYSSIAVRVFAGGTSGPDSDLYPFRIGGYSTIRGYPFQAFEGTNAFFINLEYRFTFIERIFFAFPGRWSSGTIRGLFFVDAGGAFDDPKQFHAFHDSGETRDLHMSIGTGIHFMNFLWFIFPGSIMKIEWSSPYDMKRSLPITKWQGNLSIGFNF